MSERETHTRRLLGLPDLAYLLGLLVPLTVYTIALKGASVVDEQGGAGGPLEVLRLMRSDLLFAAGYAVMWVGLFAMARRGLARRVVVVLFHAVSLAVVANATVAYQYFQGTGSTLDWSVIVFYIGTLGEVKGIIASEASPLVWAGLVAALAYVILGPPLARRVVRLVARRSASAKPSRPAAVGLCVAAFALVSLSFLPGTADANRAFSRSPFVNVVVTSVMAPSAAELTVERAAARAESPLDKARLQETPEADKRNVVLIHLESTRSRSVTPYNKDLKTTPFLDELASRSLLAERAYTTMPHTSKALTSLNCGIYPDPDTDIHEAEPGGIPARCLADLLGEQGYKSVFFQSATETFENRPQLAKNFGYDQFYGLEDMSRDGFERAGSLGFEDDIMLGPSRRWLEENGDDGPFLAAYVGVTPHYEYLAPDRYGSKKFTDKDVLNHYLNAVHYDDFWVHNLIQQYKDLGLYKDTIFVIYGDHGEAFGEHGVKGHDGVPYEEGLRIPLIIHDPQRFQNGARVGEKTPANLMDVAPTIMDMLVYKVADGHYPGASLLDLPADRPLYFSCRPDLLCMASIHGDKKYIYNYGNRPEEFYDLSKDPLEENNLAGRLGRQGLERRRHELLAWRSKVAAIYDKASGGSE